MSESLAEAIFTWCQNMMPDDGRTIHGRTLWKWRRHASELEAALATTELRLEAAAEFAHYVAEYAPPEHLSRIKSRARTWLADQEPAEESET